MHTPGVTLTALERVSELSLHVVELQERCEHERVIQQAQHVALLTMLVARVKPSLLLITKDFEGMNIASVCIAPLAKRHIVRRSSVDGPCPEGLHLTCKGVFCEVTIPASAAYGETQCHSVYLSLEQVAQHYQVDDLAAELIRILERRRDEISAPLKRLESRVAINGEVRS